jgi:hypothetical protein
MSRIAADATDFAGRTSALPWRLPHGPLECGRCGSSLTGRRKRVRRASVGGVQFEIESYRCPCGRGKHIRREVATR